MKFLVLSDTHRRIDRVQAALKLNHDADAVFFLGDGLLDVSTDACGGLTVFAVRGNCDRTSLFGGNEPSELFCRFDEYNILMMHGHLYGVKYDYETAVEYAYGKGADILLFGHTHIPFEKYFPTESKIGNTVCERPFYAFNPGSAGCGYPPTFGTLTLTREGALFGHGIL